MNKKIIILELVHNNKINYPWLLFILNPEQYGFCVVKAKEN